MLAKAGVGGGWQNLKFLMSRRPPLAKIRPASSSNSSLCCHAWGWLLHNSFVILAPLGMQMRTELLCGTIYRCSPLDMRFSSGNYIAMGEGCCKEISIACHMNSKLLGFSTTRPSFWLRLDCALAERSFIAPSMEVQPWLSAFLPKATAKCA